MAKTDDTLDRYATKDVTGAGMLNRFDAATAKFKNGAGRGSIVKSAQGNVFEFPVFVSSSVPMDYATATTSLLEQIYAAYLQMAISINPVVDADSVKKGLQFADFKVDTNKYLEYTELDYQHDACHAEYVEENAKFTFDLLSVTDSEARLINEAVDYQPLSEFEHFFQEAPVNYNDISDMRLYPIPQSTNTSFFDPTDPSAGSYNEITDPDKIQFATIPEIRSILNERGYQPNTIDELIENLDNTVERYEFPTMNSFDLRGINPETAREMRDIETICSNTSRQDFFNKNNSQMKAVVTRLDEIGKDYPMFKQAMLANMTSFEDARNRAVAQTDLWRSQKTSADERLNIDQRTNRDLEYTDANGNKRTISADDFAAAQRAAAQARATADERANKDLEYTDSNGNKIKISADDFAAAQRASAQARAEIDRRNAEIANSRYYQALNAINTGAQTVGNVANAINSSVNAVNSTANAIYNVKTLNTRIDNDKLNNQLLKDRIDNLDTDRALRKTEVNAKAAAHAPQYVDDSKCQKLNTMKPLLMNVTINMLNKDDSLQPINYVIGVKTRSRVVPASILPEVAKYPLKEMDKISRKIKWRAGELKFFKDLIFRINEKKQTAADSRDPNRKWYRRLYELAHMKGDAPTTAVVQGKSLFKTFLQAKQGKDKLKHGLIPNASIIMSQNDVDNIKNQTNIDLLKAGAAKKFCGELFLLSFIIIDLDAESIKVLLPDQYADFDVQDLGAVKKQLATLDTSGTKTRDMFKLLG